MTGNSWLRGMAVTLWLCIALPLPAQTPARLFPIRHGDLHGLIDAKGRVVVPPEFEELKIGDPLILVRKSARTAYMDQDGTMAIAPQADLRLPFAEGLTPAPLPDRQGRTRWGYVDPARKVVIEPAFAHAEGFADGLAVVGVEDAWGAIRYGAIDRKGNWVLQPVHDKIVPHSGGVLRVESKGRTHRAYDRNGKDITPEGVDFVGITSEGMVRIWSARKQGFMTAAGDVVVRPKYESASDFRDGMARVWVEGKIGFIDTRGRLAVAAVWDAAEDFSDGVALVKNGDRPVYLDREGKVVLQVEAERAYPFSEGLAVVRRGGKYGFIDRAGKAVIEPGFDFARPFKHGLAFVTQGRVSGYVTPSGQFVWSSQR